MLVCMPVYKITNKCLHSAVCLLCISVLHHQFFERCGAPIKIETARRLLEEADDDKSGAIGFEEFKSLITELVLFKSTVPQDAPTLRGSEKF